MRASRVLSAILASVMAFSLTACSSDIDNMTVGELREEGKSKANDIWEDAKDRVNKWFDSSNNEGEEPDYQWSLDKYPNYYSVTGKAQIPSDMPEIGEVVNTAPDSLGRSGQAKGIIMYTLMKSGSLRDRDMPSTITGYPAKNTEVYINLTAADTCSLPKNQQPRNSCYHGWMYNKSHLIAKSLGGEDTAENMITGTRTQNVGKNSTAEPGGMAFTETEARDWLNANRSGSIEYVATPIYTGEELLPRVVTVDIRTSDGSIDQHVVVYNYANGYSINYKDASFKKVD